MALNELNGFIDLDYIKSNNKIIFKSSQIWYNVKSIELCKSKLNLNLLKRCLSVGKQIAVAPFSLTNTNIGSVLNFRHPLSQNIGVHFFNG